MPARSYDTEAAAQTIHHLRDLAANAATDDEAAAVAERIRAFARRVRTAQWESYPWQHPHIHPPGWISQRAPGKQVCDERCLTLPTVTIPTHRYWLQRGGRGTGKALALDTPLPTPDGWITMGNVSVGDTLFDEHGLLCTVTAVYDVTPTAPQRITFSDGATIDACEDHQWVTLDTHDRKRLNRTQASIPTEWAAKPSITTQTIVDTLTYGPRSDRNHCIPLAAPLSTPERHLPLDPWVLGYWLGNGGRNSGKITMGADDEPYVRARLRRPAGRTYHERAVTFTVTGLVPELHALGVLDVKHVPSIYLRGSVQQRRDLLAGLLDSDGHMAPNGAVEFSSKDLCLSQAVLELARSLGYKATLNTTGSQLNGRRMADRHRVTWRATPDCPFQSPRKAAAWPGPSAAQSLRQQHRMIVSAGPIPVAPMRCVTVDSPNSMYLAGEAMIPTHNTEGAAFYINQHAESPPCDPRVAGGHRFTIVAPTQADAVSACVEGVSGLKSLNPGIVVTTNREGTTARWPNGSVAKLVGGHTQQDVQRLRAWSNVCIAEDTLIETEHGPRPIQDVRPGDRVWTRTGLRTVLHSGPTGTAPVMRVTAPGADVWLTPDHPVAQADGRFVPAADIDGRVQVWIEQQSSMTGTPTDRVKILATTQESLGSSTESSTPARSAPSHPAGTFTIETGTAPTTKPATSGLWTPQHMPLSTLTTGPRSGTLPEDVLLLLLDLFTTASVLDAGQSSPTRPYDLTEPSSAPTPAGTPVHRHGHTNGACAACVERGTPVLAGTAPGHAPRDAALSPPTRHARVYDLAVAGHHEFFAGGLLVGNCCCWVEEAAAIPRLGEVLGQLPYTLRLGPNAHGVITTTPLNRPEIVALIDGGHPTIPKAAVETWGRTQDAHRLPASVRDALTETFGGTTAGRQELDGDLLGDVEGALWVMERPDLVDGVINTDDRPGINNDRIPTGTVSWTPHEVLPIERRFGIPLPPPVPDGATIRLQRVAVGVDPAGGATENGISVVGSAGNRGYVLADLSMKGGPDAWGKIAVLAYLDYGAEGIALERTYGGDQTEHVIQTAAEALGVPMPPLLKAPTVEGKKQRAIPLQALAQQHRLSFVGSLPLLEGELTTWVEDETPDSPNRLDAFVHAGRHLLVRSKPARTSSPVGRGRIESSWAGTGR